ncbi:carboxypeptidase-like regulatory domain-containing protein [uncultured Tenacibaculum sp.]|uniref:carboxypeptidase-like regulatory domain-containing protein n=1 Tax=uncultured Tenacibaculum sp. TaxID=174713 RepID=UPI002608B762|nr:carboxypeptidase-like regulatory domain-containing protein [uncultured Tenacibaculum sp.]
MKNISFLILLLISINLCSQNERRYIHGKILDKIGILPNVHIINLNTKHGTYTNSNGDFKIPAKVNDSLRFSYVGYETKVINVLDKYFGMHDNTFFIKKIAYTLNEVEIKKHNLQGSITSDIRKTPEDKREEALRKTMDFSKVDMSVVEPNDHIDERVRPHIVNTDPTANFEGVGATAIIPFGYSKRLWALRKELAIKKGMPAKLLAELGEKYFFEELQIPPERYYHFLEYCNPLGIEQLHKEGETLKIIKILTTEHIKYLEIIKKQ